MERVRIYKIFIRNPGCLPFQAWRTNRFQSRSRPKLTGRVLVSPGSWKIESSLVTLVFS